MGRISNIVNMTLVDFYRECLGLKLKNPTMHLFHIPQYTQNRNVHISVLNGVVWDMGQVHCGICETGLLCKHWRRKVVTVMYLGVLKAARLRVSHAVSKDNVVTAMAFLPRLSFTDWLLIQSQWRIVEWKYRVSIVKWTRRKKHQWHL